jgi:hypothetical protein
LKRSWCRDSIGSSVNWKSNLDQRITGSGLSWIHHLELCIERTKKSRSEKNSTKPFDPSGVQRIFRSVISTRRGLARDRRDVRTLDHGDHPPRLGPAFLGAIGKLTEHSRRFSCSLMLLFSFLHRAADDPSQALVPRKPEYVVHIAVFAPSQQLLATEAGVRPQNNPGLRPPGADLLHDALYLFEASRARVDVRGSQSRTQQMVGPRPRGARLKREGQSFRRS